VAHLGLLQLDRRISFNRDTIQSPNLSTEFDKEDLVSLGKLVHDGYTRDEQSRAKWFKRMEAAMDLAMQVSKDKSFPWPGCSNVIFPLVTIAALQFSSRTYSNIIQGTDIVRYRTAGDDPSGELTKRAIRLGRHMSWQILEEDKAWEEQHDRLFIQLGIVGTTFVKTYQSAQRRCVVGELVSARDLVMDYWAASVDACARKTQIFTLYRNEVYERAMRDTFDPKVLEAEWFEKPPLLPTSHPSRQQQQNRQGLMPPPQGTDEDAPITFLEQHRYLDLDHDGYAEPYIVTIEESTQEVVRIVARVEQEEAVERNSSKKVVCIRPQEYYTKYSFIPAPDGGMYDIGFGILLGPLNESVNTGINQLLDSGTMQNSLGGFLGRGAKIRGGVYTMAPWEWKRVDSTGDDLRKNMVPYPERQPSVVTFQLLSLLINYTDRLAGTVDVMMGENPGQNTPAYNFKGMIEQGMQVYSTIFKRVWRSLKNEFEKRHQLNGIYLPDRVRFGGPGEFIMAEDYKTNFEDVAPAADPSVVSDAQRMQKAVTVKEAAMTTPGYNIEEVERNFLRAMRIEGVDVLYPGPDKAPPLPNPAAAAEEMKMKAKQMDLEYRKQEWTAKLMEQRRLNTAQIIKLRAEVMKIMQEVRGAEAEQKVRVLEMMIEAREKEDEMLNERISSLMGAGGTASGEANGSTGPGASESGGMGELADTPDDSEVPEAPAPVEGESEGAVG
jgi:chaperonin GroES